ncbi:MAG: MFS transporter, partial [Acidobacteria bacterium]|nr:MFS transporter [Acidobacteriota bacterium]
VGQEGVFYGTLVAVAISGSPFQATLIGGAKVLPGAVLGLLGGAVADALPRRIALGLGYAAQAALCVVIPIVFGTSFAPLLLLVFGVSILNQFVNPSEKAVIPLVSSREQISTAAATMSLTDSIATGVGTAAIAPIIMKVFGLTPMLIVSAAFLVFAAIRVFALPFRQHIGVREALQRLDLSELDLGFRSAIRWLAGWPAVTTMVMVGLVVSILKTISQTLGPTYVGDVLGEDPANTVYVFAPAGIGAVVALLIAPWLIDKIGERWTAMIAVLIQCVALFTMAFIDVLAPVLGPISPLRIVELFGVELSNKILAAAYVSMFTGFAVSASSVSVQTYINRRVPMLQQGPGKAGTHDAKRRQDRRPHIVFIGLTGDCFNHPSQEQVAVVTIGINLSRPML